MRSIDIDYFVKEWMPEHPEWDFYDMDKMYYDDEWQGELPIIDAEPIVHAHWITMSDKCGTFYCCSNCGEDLPRHFVKKPSHNDLYGELISIDKTPRCPCCGAIMDEEVNNDA